MRTVRCAVQGWLGDGRGPAGSVSAEMMTLMAALWQLFLFFHVSRKASSCLLSVMRKHTGAGSFATEVLDDGGRLPAAGFRLHETRSKSSEESPAMSLEQCDVRAERALLPSVFH